VAPLSKQKKTFKHPRARPQPHTQRRKQHVSLIRGTSAIAGVLLFCFYDTA